jgi:hypothetical protein
MKKVFSALAGVVLVALLIGAQGTAPITAQPLGSPLPCPPDVTLPGSICVVETKPLITGEGVQRVRVWLPAVMR